MSFSTLKTFDPYNVMDLDRNATLDDIKARFRKLTLKYHPDRNRRKRGYNPQIYDDICKAYAILSNPEHRKDYDRQFAPSWHDMREATHDFISEQQRQSRSLSEIQAERDGMSNDSRFTPRQKFGDGDLSAFNDMFDKTRATDPNDHGYGNQMSERMTEEQAKGWSSSVSDIRQDNMFKGQSFNQQDFNRIFDERNGRDASRDIMERNDGNPSAFSLMNQHAFTDIAVHGGHMIVGKDTRNYTKQPSSGNELGWVDYKAGFDTISSQVPDNVRQRYENNESIDRMFQQRMAEHSSNPYDEIPENERKSFSQAKEDMIRRKQLQIEREEKMHRDVVLKYKSQYGENYLEHKTPSRGSEQPHPSEISGPPGTHGQQRYNTPHSQQSQSSSNFNQQTRDKDFNTKNINDRMNERQFMM